MNSIRRPIVMTAAEQRKLTHFVEHCRRQVLTYQARLMFWKTGCIGLSILCLVLLITGQSSKTNALKLASQICAIKTAQP